MLTVKGETPISFASVKCTATHSDDDNVHHPTPFKHAKQAPADTQPVSGPGLSMRQQTNASAKTSQVVTMDDWDDSSLIQVTREEGRDQQCKMKERKAGEEALKVTENEAEKVAKEVAREAARAEKEATKKEEEERKAAKKVIEKAANENEKAKKKLTSKTLISQNLMPVDPIIKVKNK